MAQTFTQKAVTTFIKGLITEAGELTFPPDASVDESNCSLERDGSRSRRLAVNYETSNVLSDNSYTPGQVMRTLTWENVGGVAGREFAVVQIGADIIFYDKGTEPLSEAAVSISAINSSVYTLDLTGNDSSGSALQRVGGLGAALEPIQVTSLNGAVIVSSPEINTFVITRDETTLEFTTDVINFKVRDFEWQGDPDTYPTAIATASASIGRKYDTANTGWTGTKGAAALATYDTDESDYPALTHPWYSGKDSDGDFSTAEWLKIFSGTTLAVNGHFVLDLFNKDRDTASGLTGVTTSTETTRFRTVATFSSRVFYAGLSSPTNSSKIYFSQHADNLNLLGKCYQVNDPTSEEFSDLLDTDGGFILIPEAHNVQKLHVMGSMLLVFAENGVWSVSGADDIFRASSYSVNKVSAVGIINPESFVSAQGRPYWWSTTGIHTLSPDQVTGSLVEQNISLGTIQTFWNNISGDGKSKAIGEYDAVNKQVFWLYSSISEAVDYKFNEVLVLDEVLQAFYPWTISDEVGTTNYICGTSFFRGTGSTTVDYTVVDNSGNTVLDSLGNTVVVERNVNSFNHDSTIKFLAWDGDTDKLTFAEFSDISFLDWGTTDYISFAEAGYDFLGDMSRKKTSPYLTVYLRRTETGWAGNEVDGYNPVRPSSCKVSAFWDFKPNSSSTAQEAYRHKRVQVVDASDLNSYDHPSTVMTTRLKLRGRGRSVRLRFESTRGKDFKLLGYEMIGGRNPGL